MTGPGFPPNGEEQTIPQTTQLSRQYIGSKKIETTDRRLYAGYRYLNWYVEINGLKRGPESVDLHGLFLSDIPTKYNLSHGNEIHFPVIFINGKQAEALFRSISSDRDVKRFEELMKAMTLEDCL